MYWDINRTLSMGQVDLIYHIFPTRPHHGVNSDEMARMSYRTNIGMGMILSRQAGGIGTRGLGETNTELMKRHWKREMKRVTENWANSKDSRKTNRA